VPAADRGQFTFCRDARCHADKRADARCHAAGHVLGSAAMVVASMFGTFCRRSGRLIFGFHRPAGLSSLSIIMAVRLFGHSFE
jgi:hypothetical protein